MKFIKQDKSEIKPNLHQYIRNYVKGLDGPFIIMVGADSLPPNKTHSTIVGVVAIYRIGKGAHIVYTKKKLPAKEMRQIARRLWSEVELSLEIAKEIDILTLQRLFPEKVESLQINIQLDFNSDERYKSGKLKESAVGYVTAMGYDCSIKPFAWAATYAADKICRGQF